MDPNSIQQKSSIFNSQKLLSKLPFKNTEFGELHYYDPINKKHDAYCGPLTKLNIRCQEGCNENNLLEPKEFNKTQLTCGPEGGARYNYNQVSKVAHLHDHLYESAENDLNKKHDADKLMLELLDHITPDTFNERMQKFIVSKIIGLKLKLALGFHPAEQYSKEGHHPIRHKFQRRKVIAYGIDEIHAGDLMDFSKDPIYNGNRKYTYCLVNIDVFSKFLWCFMIKDKSTENIIECYKLIFTNRKPEKMWWDMEKSVFSKKSQEFFTENKVTLYHTNSELKSCVVERVIRTLKDKCERIKTEYEQLGKPYNLFELLPQVVNSYNNTVHRTTGLTPIDGSMKKNEDKLKKLYLEKYLDYEPKNGKIFEIGDKIRLYAKKSIFDKGSKANWTDEIFTVSKIFNTKPITYEISDKSGEIIQGKVYSWEMVESKLD